MARRNVLITGCSSGIGLALAVKMAKDEQKRFKGNNLSVLYLYKNILYKMVLLFLCDLIGGCIQFGDLFLVCFPLRLSRKYSENILFSVSSWYFCTCIETEQLLELNSLHTDTTKKDSSVKWIAENICRIMLLWVYIHSCG